MVALGPEGIRQRERKGRVGSSVVRILPPKAGRYRKREFIVDDELVDFKRV